MKKIKYLTCFILMLFFSFNFCHSISAHATFIPDNEVACSILTDASGSVIMYEHNADEKRPVASIVKLMTIYLTLKEIDAGNISLEDKVTISPRAAGMGGSQIFLDAGSEHTVANLLKSVVISSANDSSVALAEHISGSVESFVDKMNTTAQELGMDNTRYVNVNGLPAPEQYSTARDIARLMSKVSQYPLFCEYSKIQLEDYVHPTGRITQMSNTNKLLRTNLGIDCGKTGSTVDAGYCFATKAHKGDLGLIAVVLKADDSKTRFAHTAELLEYGYANYEAKQAITDVELQAKSISIAYTDKTVPLTLTENVVCIAKKGEQGDIEIDYDLPSVVRQAKKGEKLGSVAVIENGVLVKRVDIIAKEDVAGATYIDNVKSLLESFA